MKKLLSAILVVSAVAVGAGCKSQLNNYAPTRPSVPLADQMYDMKIGDQINVSATVDIVRVPGGWVYEYSPSYGGGPCFIPFSDEGRK